MNDLFCIVGLGNPGPTYVWNRHNVGFMELEELAAYYKLGEWKLSPKISLVQGAIDGSKVILVKPMQYMNRSGVVLQEVLSFYKIPLDNLLVIHDDLDLALGRLKLKKGGGSGGHNGLKDIDQHCGQDYWRLRIGIDHPGHKDQVHGHVLGNFTLSEREVLGPRLDLICDSIPWWLSKNYDRCMQKIGE